MAEPDSDFWNRTAKGFASIHQSERQKKGLILRAHWIRIEGCNSDEWDLIPRDEPVTLEFGALARRAGDRLAPTAEDALVAWLTELKKRIASDR